VAGDELRYHMTSPVSQYQRKRGSSLASQYQPNATNQPGVKVPAPVSKDKFEKCLSIL